MSKSEINAFMANTRELTVPTVAEATALTFPNDGGDFWVRIEERGGAKFKTSATGSGDGFSSLLRDDGGYLELDESGVVTPEMFGITGQNPLFTDGAGLQAMLDMARPIDWGGKDKVYRSELPLTASFYSAKSDGASLISSVNGDAIRVSGTLLATTTATADYNSDDKFISVSDSTGFEAGKLVNITSTESLISSRDTYYKGINAIIEKVVGNNIYLSRSAPFGMTVTGETITVKCYEPAAFMHTGRFNISNSGALPNGVTGLFVEHAKLPVINDIFSDNFVACISVWRSVGVALNNIETGRAYYTGTGTSYGVSINSCTGVNSRNIHTRTGRHGYATGGNEPIFDHVLDGFVIDNELQAREELTIAALDHHANMWNSECKNGSCRSFNVGGNTNLRKVHVMDEQGINLPCGLAYGEEPEHANYILDDITFENGSGEIRTLGFTQNDTLTRVNIGSIKMRDVKGLSTAVLDIEATYNGAGIPTGNIGSFIAEDCDSFLVKQRDVVNKLSVTRAKNITENTVILLQETGANEIKTVSYDSCDLPHRFNAINLSNFGACKIKSCELVDVGGIASSSLQFDGASSEVYIEDTDLSTLGRGVEITTSLGKWFGVNSPVNWFGTDDTLITTLTEYN